MEEAGACIHVPAKELTYMPPFILSQQNEYLFESVIFSKGGHSYDYISEIPDVAIGDKVIVFANGEEKEVEIVRLFNMAIGNMPLAIEKYKKILRKV